MELNTGKPTIGQLADCEDILGTERMNALLSGQDITISFAEKSRLLNIIAGSETEHSDMNVQEAERHISFFLTHAAILSSRVKLLQPAFLLLTMPPEMMAQAFQQLQQQLPGMVAALGHSLSGVLQEIQKTMPDIEN